MCHLPRITPTAILLAAALLLAACAAGPHPLLRAEPAGMNDAALLRYYYDLGEAIEECERSTQGDTTVSVGTGTGTGGTWGTVVVGQTVGQGCDSTALRRRRAEVRTQLSGRGISP